MAMKKTLHLMISGRVQGVGYRMGFDAEARRLGVAGWVRNRHDGHVEALIQGEELAIDVLITWSRRGPPAARVHQVVETLVESDSSGEMTGFKVRATE
jgi:acylphosphatase